MAKDRLILHTVHTDDGATEIYWARSHDDMLIEEWEGSILFHDDGGITHKSWSDNEEPIVVHILGNRVIVANGEDQPPDPASDIIVFDSKTYINPGGDTK